MKDTGPVVELLRQRIREYVDTRFDVPECRDAVLGRLSQRGFALHEDAPCRAGVLSIEAYRVARGAQDDLGLTAAAAVQLHMDAACAMDDIVDSQGLADPQAVAVALQLLASGYALACEAALGSGRGSGGFAPLLDFHRHWSIACDGFFLDASLMRRDAWTLDGALDMTVRKSGALGRFAAAFGAGMAAETSGIIAGLGDVGEAVFTYRQLVDDLRDACSPADGTSDLCRGKKTVPLVFFHNYLEQLGDGELGGRLDPLGPEAALHYERSGAAVYGAIVAETFLNRAKTTLAALEADDLAVENIERLVATIEAGSCDAVPA